jgi:hypothetical protein
MIDSTSLHVGLTMGLIHSSWSPKLRGTCRPTAANDALYEPALREMGPNRLTASSYSTPPRPPRHYYEAA